MIWHLLLLLSTPVTIWLGAKLWRATSRYAYIPTKADNWYELPTVSVCVAARNETHALAQNLEYVLASDYKKLEILVLDDSSDDDTSLIIKSFAHAGVRFIAGQPLSPGWIGRNYAYQTLAKEASGEYILFLDVDTLLGTTTVSQLVHQILANNKTMLSVLARREDTLRANALLGTLRYMWELALSSASNPPSSSAIWMIQRKALLSLDKDLSSYALSVRPEQHIAKLLQKTKQYYYLLSTPQLGIRYEKRWHSQRETAERLYFPQFGRSMKGFLRTVFGFVLLISPLFALFMAMRGTLVAWAGVLLLYGFVCFAKFTFATYRSPGAVLRTVLWPYLLIQDFALYLLSSYRYATHSVQWKGRAIQAQPSNNSHYEINE